MNHVYHSVVIGRKEILDFLRDSGSEIPSDSDVFFRDYNGTNVDLEDVAEEEQSAVIYVKWVTLL